MEEELKLQTFPGLNTDGNLQHDSRSPIAWEENNSDPKSSCWGKPQFSGLFDKEPKEALKPAIEAATKAAEILTASLNETLTQFNARLEKSLEQLNAEIQLSHQKLRKIKTNLMNWNLNLQKLK